jgi:hypothetical protein
MAIPPTGTAGDGGRTQPGPAPGRKEKITMMIWYGGHWPVWQAGLMRIAVIAFWALLDSADQSPARSGSAW